ncbi:MAG: hypothetical protein AAF391_02185 [Bacteroidota bacterium]
MKNIALTLACLMAITGYGQVTHTHKLSLGIGNEWNAFLSPSTFVEDDEVRRHSDLWDNGTFQSVSLKNSIKNEGSRYKLKVKVNGSLGVFQTEQNSNRYTYRLGLSYRLKYASKKYFEFAPELFRKKREGLNTDNAVLATPFSYLVFKMPIGFDFYLGNKSWLKTQAGYLYKNYDKTQGEKLYYQAPFLEAVYSKKWEAETSFKKFALKSTTQLRNYHTLSLKNEFEELEEEEFEEREELDDEVIYQEGSRNWMYQFTTLMIDFTKGDTRKVGIGFYHVSRIDHRSRSTYHELGPGILYDEMLGKIGFKSSIRYTIRNYTKLSPSSESSIPLQYKYLRANLELNYPINGTGQIYGKGSFVNRTSNNPNLESLSFRDYFNGFVEIGLRWEW